MLRGLRGQDAAAAGRSMLQILKRSAKSLGCFVFYVFFLFFFLGGGVTYSCFFY